MATSTRHSRQISVSPYHSLHDHVTDQIRDMIVQSDLLPGHAIDEIALADELDVSRTPVREALKVLAHEGLIAIVPNRGSFVSISSPDDVHDILEVLAEVEGITAKLACARATDDDLESVRRAHNDMLVAFRKRDKPEYFRLNQSIHDHIANAAGNPFLFETHQHYTRRVRRMRYLSNIEPADWKRSIAGHQGILEALEDRNKRLAYRLAKEHVETIWPAIKTFVEQESEAFAKMNKRGRRARK